MLDKILYLSILFFLPLLYLPGEKLFYAKGLFLIILLPIVIIANSVLRNNETENRYDSYVVICIILIAISHLLSLVFSINPKESLFGIFPRYYGFLPEFGAFLMFVVVFFSNRFLSKEKFARIFKMLFIPFFAILIFAVVQFVFSLSYFDKNLFEGRIDSLLGNPNVLALYILLMFPVLVSLFWNNKSSIEKIGLSILLLFVVFVLMLTGSRTAFIIFVVNLAVFAFFYFKKRKMNFLKIAIVCVLAVLILFTFFRAIPRQIRERYLFANRHLISGDTRLSIWHDTIPVVMKRPFFGFGHDQFADAFKSNSNSALLKEASVVDRAHNYLLDVLVERGLFGIIGMFLLIGYVLFKTLKFVWNNDKDDITAMFMGLLSTSLPSSIFPPSTPDKCMSTPRLQIR